GVLLLTTRSKGFPYHGYPYDFWRYEPPDVRRIFADFDIDVVDTDDVSPGVFLKAHKPLSFVEQDLEGIDLYSIVTNRHSHDVTDTDVYLRRIRHKVRRFAARILPTSILTSIDRAVTNEER